MPPTGTWPATQACALTGTQSSDLSVHRPALNPLNHTSQDEFDQSFKSFLSFLLYFFNPHQRTCLLILERRKGGREGEKHRWRGKHGLVALYMHSDWDWTCNPLVYGMTLQPTEPHRPGQKAFFLMYTKNICNT